MSWQSHKLISARMLNAVNLRLTSLAWVKPLTMLMVTARRPRQMGCSCIQIQTVPSCTGCKSPTPLLRRTFVQLVDQEHVMKNGEGLFQGEFEKFYPCSNCSIFSNAMQTRVRQNITSLLRCLWWRSELWLWMMMRREWCVYENRRWFTLCAVTLGLHN